MKILNTIIKSIKPLPTRNYDRIYFHHLPKTGGTSLNFGFISHFASTERPSIVYENIASHEAHKIEKNGNVIVGWNTTLLNSKNYTYGFSHRAAHELNLPSRTLTISIFRDPLDRVVSYYNMLRHYKENDIQHPVMRHNWAGLEFDAFIETIPKSHLLRQLYHYSKSYNPYLAATYINFTINIKFNTKNFPTGVQLIKKSTGIDLHPYREKNYKYSEKIAPKLLKKTREILSPEYKMMELINFDS